MSAQTFRELYQGWKETEWVDESDAMELADLMADAANNRIAELEAAANTSICIFCHEIMSKDLTVILEHAAGCEKRPENRLMARVAELEAIVTEALPFIGYEACVPDLVQRAEDAVGYGEATP